MRISVLDPGLRHRAGHHFDIDSRVCEALVESGHDVMLYTSKRVDEKVRSHLKDICDVRAIFTANPYADASRIDKIAGSLISFNQQSQLLADELRQVVAADLVLFPTVFPAHLNACGLAKVSAPVAGCVHVPTAAKDACNDIFWRYAMLHLRSAAVPFRLGVIEPELFIHYQSIALNDFQIELWPIPHDGCSLKAPKTQLNKIGFLGHQRGEKVIPEMPGLVNGLLANGYKILVQDSADLLTHQLSGEVERVGFTEHFAQLIATCDCVVLPYDMDSYKEKGSGVLWEAMASGVPVVAPLGTAPGRWVSQHQNGTLFADRTNASIRSAIDELSRGFSTYARNAFGVSQSWLAHHGTLNFCKKVTERANLIGA